jgi:mannose-1-phosphate guanylyltransferase/mannose-6-phosphate isomerase
LGIKPYYPSTVFGYIKKAGLVKSGESDVVEFKEKPDLETAQKYLDSGNYDWNGGMFVMRASVWLNCLKIFEELLLNKTIEAYQQKTEDNIFIRPHAEIFKSIAPISIDYAVLERLPNSQIPIKAISIDVGWNDMGSWDAVWEAEDHDENGNVQYGDALLKNTSNSLIYASDRLVVTSGIKDLVVIETADSILVLDRHKTQDVKLIVAELESQKREEHNLHRKVLPLGVGLIR